MSKCKEWAMAGNHGDVGCYIWVKSRKFNQFPPVGPSSNKARQSYPEAALGIV